MKAFQQASKREKQKLEYNQSYVGISLHMTLKYFSSFEFLFQI